MVEKDPNQLKHPCGIANLDTPSNGDSKNFAFCASGGSAFLKHYLIIQLFRFTKNHWKFAKLPSSLSVYHVNTPNNKFSER